MQGNTTTGKTTWWKSVDDNMRGPQNLEMDTLHSESLMSEIKAWGQATLYDVKQRSGCLVPAEAQWGFLKKWTLWKCQVMMRGSVEKNSPGGEGMTWNLDELANTSYFHQERSVNPAQWGWNNEPEQRLMVYIHRKGDWIIFYYIAL